VGNQRLCRLGQKRHCGGSGNIRLFLDCVAKLGKVHATSNNRIAAGTLLNQNCVVESGVESILRTSLTTSLAKAE
jgi:hypothetical protein